ncbi:hypothetical protein FJZ20_01980 [Candidatus Pacearchaeota archaeon]|nr:hypothetical protein [Candidatus Pacearchaeota archaeon]
MKTILIVLAILLISMISAQNIELNYPEEVYVNEEFSFKISLLDFETGTYDVKIDIFGEGNRISRILDGENWKSTYYYLTNAISNDEEKEFTLKIENYVGVADIEIKIRNSETTVVKTFSDYDIKSIQGGYSSEETLEEEEEQENETENDEAISSVNPNEINVISTSISEKENAEEVQTLVLNPKDIKSEENSEKLKKIYPLYGLILFSFLLAILFWVRKKGNKNEF